MRRTRPMVCPDCINKPGMYYGCLLVPGVKETLKCPNCKTVLVPVKRVK